MPYMGQTEAEGSREERLRQLLTALEWKHLTKTQRENLGSFALKHNELFILDSNEIGTFDLPPAN